MKLFVVALCLFAVAVNVQGGNIGHGGPVNHGPIEAAGAVYPIAQGPHLESSGGHEAAAVVAAAPSRPRLHEIHTHSAKSVIRVEEYARPNQVIRVHEAPQGPPEIIKVKGPAEPQSLIRVVAKSSGPAHIERVVHRPRGVQVVNVQKPAGAPARIVHVVREAAPAPRVEFINEPERQSHIYVAQSPGGSEVVLAPRSSPGPAIGGSGFSDAAYGGGGAILALAAPNAQEGGPVIADAPAAGPVGYAAAGPSADFNSVPIQAHSDDGYGGHHEHVKTKIIRKYHH